MTMQFSKTALFAGALLGMALIQPSAPVWAAANSPSNQLVERPAPPQGMTTGPYDPSGPASATGTYDQYDRYRNSRGFPSGGNAQLFQPAS
jgi:hypothetical protein